MAVTVFFYSERILTCLPDYPHCHSSLPLHIFKQTMICNKIYLHDSSYLWKSKNQASSQNAKYLILCSGNQLSPCEFSPQSHFLSLSSSFISNEGIHYWCIIPTQIALSSTSKWWNQACWKHFIRGPKLQCKFMLEWQAEFHLSVWAMVLFKRTRHTARVTIKALIDMQLLH